MAVLADVEERLPIVDGDMGDVLLRDSRVPATGDIGDTRETGEIAGQADADAVLQIEGGIAGIACAAGRAGGVVAQAVYEALVSDHGRSAVQRTGTARALAPAIVGRSRNPGNQSRPG